MIWAQRLKRVFNIDIETCGRCLFSREMSPHDRSSTSRDAIAEQNGIDSITINKAPGSGSSSLVFINFAIRSIDTWLSGKTEKMANTWSISSHISR
jgi:hypothetical protein